MTKERDLLKARIVELQAEVDKLKGRPPAPVVSLETNSPVLPPVRSPPAATATNVARQISGVATNVPTPEIYVVQPGDTLAKIAREHYKDATMAHTIYEANKNVMKSERDLRAGQKITLPPRRQNRGG
jgi:nucleoid-associated protein YgaU